MISFNAESKKTRKQTHIYREQTVVVRGGDGGGGEGGETGEGDQKVQASIYKINKSARCMMGSKEGTRAWVAQLVKYPTSAQIMLSGFLSSSPASGKLELCFG